MNYPKIAQPLVPESSAFAYPEYLDYLMEDQEVFLKGVCETYQGQGLEDALKGNPPLLPDVPAYMEGYLSLKPKQLLQAA